MSEEKISKLKNIPHPLYTILCYIKAIINKTFSLYSITINLLVLSVFVLPSMLIKSCMCTGWLQHLMSLYIFLLIPIIMTIKSLIKKSKNITSTFKIIIVRTLIGTLLIISAYFIAEIIILANYDPHTVDSYTVDSFSSTFKTSKLRDALRYLNQ